MTYLTATISPPRKFRFSLRTMFVSVAVAAAALAWHGRWLERRTDYLAKYSVDAEQNEGLVVAATENARNIGMLSDVSWEARAHACVLRVLGHRRREVTLVLTREARTARDSWREVQIAQELFPEATINIAVVSSRLDRSPMSGQ